LLTSKVDRLTLEQQIILKVASVIGQTFTVSMLAQLLPQEADQSNLKQDLSVIENSQMIVQVINQSNH
jgi:hypothetical protein